MKIFYLVYSEFFLYVLKGFIRPLIFSGLPHTQGTQGIQKNSGKFKVTQGRLFDSKSGNPVLFSFLVFLIGYRKQKLLFSTKVLTCFKILLIFYSFY